MIKFEVRKLCFVGAGNKIHIKYDECLTYCSAAVSEPLKVKGLIGMTEKAEELCRNCLREYKKRL